MAKYDQGGGCPCGLYRVCDCGQYDANNKEILVVKAKKEKLMAKSILSTLMKSTGNEFASLASEGITAGDVTEFYDTGSYALNAVLSGSIYGGLANNGITAFAGEKGTGKSFYALAIAKRFLDKYPEAGVFYFETESAITQESLENRDIDLERFAVIPVGTVEEFRHQALKVIEGYEGAGKEVPPILFILDSLGGLSTEKEITDMSEGSNKRDMTRAQLIRGAFRVLTLKLGKTSVPMIVTNHIYEVPGAYVPTKKMGGGSGLDYAASTTIYLSSKKAKDDKTKKVTGVILTAYVEKGRLTVKDIKVETYLDYATGLDRYYGLLDLATDFGVVTKSTKGRTFPNGATGSEADVEKNPEKYFTKDVLDAIDLKCKENFKYGGHKKKKEVA